MTESKKPRKEINNIPASEGYILVDEKKCQGCVSCMLACSLVHEGVESLSLARIQVMQNSFEKWPDDLAIEQCRQCLDAPCVQACPEDAMTVDTAFGNVRKVLPENCIGCGLCVKACPHLPGGPIVVPDEAYEGQKKSRKCDLCLDTPYWDETGGPKGKHACIEVCPIDAITFVKEIPDQSKDSGYKTNLRDQNWGNLGYPTD